MADTFVKIATVTVGAGGTSSIDFTSIPQTYTDLCLKINARSSVAQIYDAVLIDINDNTSGIYSYRRLVGNGTTASSQSASGNTQMYPNFSMNANTSTSNTFGSTEIYFPNYTSSAYKSISVDSVMETNATGAYTTAQAHLFSDTSAIAKLHLYPGGGAGVTFMQYTIATLYGINKN